MSDWSTRPLENDTAMDFIGGLVDIASLAKLRQVIDSVIDDPDSGIELQKEAVAAASLILAAAQNPIGRTIMEIREWIKLTGYVPSSDDLQKSIEALTQILSDSELKETWKETDDYENWFQQTKKIVTELQKIDPRNLPLRASKKLSTPRKFFTLVPAAGKTGDVKYREKIRKLILSMDDVNGKNADTDNKLPLRLLAAAGLLEEAILIIQKGALVDGIKDGLGSPLVYACRHGHTEMARMLLESGASLFDFELEVAEDTGKRIFDPNYTGPRKTISYVQSLWAAVGSGKIETLNLLIERGAPLNQTDINGETLLHKAVIAKQLSMTLHLLDLGLDFNKQTDTGMSPLHWAVHGRSIEIVKCLLERGCNPNLIEKYGGTALDQLEKDQESPFAALIRSYGGKTCQELGTPLWSKKSLED